MQRLGVSCAVRLIYTSLGAKGLTRPVQRRISEINYNEHLDGCCNGIDRYNVPEYS